MNVLVERYQRRKYVSQEDSQMLYYVRQKSGTVRWMSISWRMPSRRILR